MGGRPPVCTRATSETRASSVVGRGQGSTPPAAWVSSPTSALPVAQGTHGFLS